MHKVPYEQKRGGVVGHPQKGQGSMEVRVRGQGGGASSFPKPIAALLVAPLHFSLQVSTSVFL